MYNHIYNLQQQHQKQLTESQGCLLNPTSHPQQGISQINPQLGSHHPNLQNHHHRGQVNPKSTNRSSSPIPYRKSAVPSSRGHHHQRRPGNDIYVDYPHHQHQNQVHMTPNTKIATYRSNSISPNVSVTQLPANIVRVSNKVRAVSPQSNNSQIVSGYLFDGKKCSKN